MGYMDGMTDLGTVGGAAGSGAASFNPAMAIGGMAGEAASAWYANRQSQKRQREAFDQQKWMMSNRYQLQTHDLKAAGLNPMLAYTQGAPMPSSVGQASVTKPDMVNAMANAQLSTAQAAKIKQETENLKLENINISRTGANISQLYNKMLKEIAVLEQDVATGKATEAEKQALKALHEMQAKLGQQELEIKRPEQVASGLDAAEYSAMASRVLKPLIDILNGATKRR